MLRTAAGAASRSTKGSYFFYPGHAEHSTTGRTNAIDSGRHHRLPGVHGYERFADVTRALSSRSVRDAMCEGGPHLTCGSRGKSVTNQGAVWPGRGLAAVYRSGPIRRRRIEPRVWNPSRQSFRDQHVERLVSLSGLVRLAGQDKPHSSARRSTGFYHSAPPVRSFILAVADIRSTYPIRAGERLRILKAADFLCCPLTALTARKSLELEAKGIGTGWVDEVGRVGQLRASDYPAAVRGLPPLGHTHSTCPVSLMRRTISWNTPTRHGSVRSPGWRPGLPVHPLLVRRTAPGSRRADWCPYVPRLPSKRRRRCRFSYGRRAERRRVGRSRRSGVTLAVSDRKEAPADAALRRVRLRSDRLSVQRGGQHRRKPVAAATMVLRRAWRSVSDSLAGLLTTRVREESGRRAVTAATAAEWRFCAGAGASRNALAGRFRSRRGYLPVGVARDDEASSCSPRSTSSFCELSESQWRFDGKVLILAAPTGAGGDGSSDGAGWCEKRLTLDTSEVDTSGFGSTNGPRSRWFFAPGPPGDAKRVSVEPAGSGKTVCGPVCLLRLGANIGARREKRSYGIPYDDGASHGRT
jgi:hypothetical protein